MKSEFQYWSYVLRHKWFVLVAGFRLWKMVVRVRGMFWRLLVHDLSKFRRGEWIAYRRYFYEDWEPLVAVLKHMPAWTGPTAESVERDFDRAWLAHQHRNPHHWQHWILREDDGDVKALRMPYRCVVEMVADWMGAGRAITGRWGVEDWYRGNKDKMDLHPHTRKEVERILESHEPQGGPDG